MQPSMTALPPSDFYLGPYFDQLTVGQTITSAPAVTLTSGHAAMHQAILGDRLRLALDAGLVRKVVGGDAPLAHPALVWDLAIGQSTLVTRRVIANLFYRGLVFHRAPLIGDTLRTVTEVVALRQNRGKPGRPATGMAVLRVTTIDQEDRPILDFLRCAMLPLADPGGQTGAEDDLDAHVRTLKDVDLISATRTWDLDAYRAAIGGSWDPGIADGQVWTSAGGDLVSSAPELARLTLNVASAHHDETRGGPRLVYGGHTIGIAAAQITRILPDLVTIVGWHGCDHVGPVMEADTLASELELERRQTLPHGSCLAHLRSQVFAQHGPGGDRRRVLDWRLIALMP
jgi:acyl dehydratase